MLKGFFQRQSEKKARFKQALEEAEIQRKVQERMQSSNERELNRFLEEEREKEIEMRLKNFRKIRNKEAMRTTIFDGKNIFKGGDNMLKQKNIFTNQPNMFLKGGMPILK